MILSRLERTFLNNPMIVFRLDRNVIGHIEIHSPTDNLFYAEKEIKFESISELVNHYHDNPIPNNSNHPVSVMLR